MGALVLIRYFGGSGVWGFKIETITTGNVYYFKIIVNAFSAI